MRALLFLFLGAVVWGQTDRPPSISSQNAQTIASAATEMKGTASIAAEEPVITIAGLCGDFSAGKVGTSTCKTVITRSQFEALVQVVQPNLLKIEQRRFAANYAKTLISAQQAKEMGLESDPRFEALMKVQRNIVLQRLLGEAIQEKANQIPDEEVEKFYKENSRSFEEIELQRLYVPLTQQILTPGLTADELRKRRGDSAAVMKKTADELHARALEGADFSDLQGEAYKVAGYSPNGGPAQVEMKKYRASGLPVVEASTMDLNPGQISQVFDEANGRYFSKVGSKRTLPLEDARPEILKKLRSEKLQKLQQEAREAATPSFDEAYFMVTTPQNGSEP